MVEAVWVQCTPCDKQIGISWNAQTEVNTKFKVT